MDLLSQTTVVYTESSSEISAVYAWTFLLVSLLAIIVMIAAMWKIFTKAGEAGWKVLIPFYNTWVLFTIAKKPGWWLFLLFIPIVNIVISIILALELAKVFGKGPVFGILLLWLFSIIGYLILGYGDDEYQPDGKTSESQPVA